MSAIYTKGKEKVHVKLKLKQRTTYVDLNCKAIKKENLTFRLNLSHSKMSILF